jgi:hypothetical protein
MRETLHELLPSFDLLCNENEGRANPVTPTESLKY